MIQLWLSATAEKGEIPVGSLLQIGAAGFIGPNYREENVLTLTNKEKVKEKITEEGSFELQFPSPVPSAPAVFSPPSLARYPSFPRWLTQHPQGLLAPFVPRGQRGVVDRTGDGDVVVAGAHLQGELTGHVVCGVVWNGLHHIWTPWDEKTRRGDVSQEEGVCILIRVS